MTQQYITQITAVSIRAAGESMHAETATTIRLDDEGGGQYVVIEQDGNTVKINTDEWPLIRDEIEAAVARCEG